MNPEILLIVRLVLHIATAGLLLSYYRPDARFKLGPSIMAGALAASSAALAVQILTTWPELILAKPNPLMVVFVFTVFLPIALCRGDVAKLCDSMRLIRPKHWWPW